jgi:hypothetical protein
MMLSSICRYDCRELACSCLKSGGCPLLVHHLQLVHSSAEQAQRCAVVLRASCPGTVLHTAFLAAPVAVLWL